MDIFNLPKNSGVGSVDGFVNPGAKKSPLGSLDGMKTGSKNVGQVGEVNIQNDVDSFKMVDGFTPSIQTPITSPAAAKPDDIGEVYISEASEERRQVDGKKKTSRKEKRQLKKQKKLEKKQKPVKHRKLKLALKITSAVVALVVLTAGALAFKAYWKAKHIFKGTGTTVAALQDNVDPMLLKGEGDGRVNVLLLGKGGTGHAGPDLTDTLLVASIDPVAKEVALLSVPRDLWVKTKYGQTKINAVYANAKYSVLNNYTTSQQTAAIKQQAEDTGIKAIEDTISTILGIPIQYYAMVDFEGFKQAINAVGGIDIVVKTKVYDTYIANDNFGNPLIADVGNHHFDGRLALLYAQSRHGSARGDFDRTERQREVIVALKDKVLSLGTFVNPVKISSLIDSIGNHVSTSFSLSELMRVYDVVKTVDSSKITSIGLADPPNNYVTTSNINGQSVVVPRAGAFDYAEIQSYVRNTLRDSYIKSENASIMILNGTNTSGLATLKSEELKSYGYNVTSVGDAPTGNYTKTVLVDLTKGVKKYTKNYLEKRLGVTAVNSLPDTSISTGTADFVIIIGSDDAAATH